MVGPGLPQPIGRGFRIIAKVLLALAKRNLDPLAVLYVSRRPVPLDDPACFIAQRLGTEQKPAILTVEAPKPCLGLAWLAGRPRPAPCLQQRRNIVRMNGAGPSPFQGLIQR